jgi:HlyD family secretion protein
LLAKQWKGFAMNRKFAWAGMLVAAIGLAGGLFWWRYGRVEALPSHVARANGRLEMTRIDIAVKYPGRLIDLPIHEGDLVQAGMILARQDAAELQAQIVGAEAQRQRALSAIARAEDELDVRRNRQRLAKLEWDQAASMRGKALVSQVELERRRISLDGETAGMAVATQAVNEARAALSEAEAQIARLKVILGEATIRAPVSGRIEYRIVEKDAVLPSGGRIASLLESDDVYMTVFLPSQVAGKLRVGGEARIILDAFEGPALPANISFVSSEAQFTPKYVETASEREKLVYRVKLQIPVEVARRYAGALKAGQTGNGYVRTDAAKAWPSQLASPPSTEQAQ